MEKAAYSKGGNFITRLEAADAADRGSKWGLCCFPRLHDPSLRENPA